jgi:hypothetical protein
MKIKLMGFVVAGLFGAMVTPDADAGLRCCRVKTKKPRIVVGGVPKPKLPQITIDSKTVATLVIPGAAVVTVLAPNGSTIGKVTDNVTRELGKGIDNTANELGRAPKNVEKMAVAVAHYVEAQPRIQYETWRDAAERLREGKVLDAMYHAAIDPYDKQQKAAALAATENSILNAVGATAAAVYGGPAGASAYAAWLTYNQTKDPELAIRMGVIAGLTSMANAKVGEMSTGLAPSAGVSTASTATVTITPEMLQKAAVAGAVGGLAIAAAGGKEDAIREGFIRSGAMVLIQDGYRQYTGKAMDPAASKEGPVCTSAIPGIECGRTRVAVDEDGYPIRRDASGNMIRASGVSADGRPTYPNIADVNITDKDGNLVYGFVGEPGSAGAGVNLVGQASMVPTRAPLSEAGGPMNIVSQVPGANAMALFHDTWVINADMGSLANKATIVPAIVLTYTGTPGPLMDHILDTGVENANKDAGKAKAAQVAPSFVCTKDKDARYIGIRTAQSPGEMACAVIYEQNGKVESPWHAQVDAQYCNDKPDLLAADLGKQGFYCSVGAL